MRRLASALLAVFCASCRPSVAPQTSSPFDDEQVLATVGTEKITKAEFEAAIAHHPIPPDALLDELIEHRALVQQAREKGYDRDPQHLAAVENLLANRVREELRETQKWDVTPAEIEARYRADAAKYSVPAKIRVAMIFVECPSAFTEEKRAERRRAIETAREKAAETPAQFATLAAEFSYDQGTKYRGGDLGYLVEGTGAEELAPEVLKSAFALGKPGDLSEIITTAKGFHLLQLTEKSEATVRPLAAATAQIRAELQREKQQHADQLFKSTLLANRKIETRRARLPAASATRTPATPTTPPALPVER